LSRKLMEYNDELEQVKKRLVMYSENVADITREKEILAAKISIHDRLGNALLAAIRYIETGEEAISRKTLLEIWQSNIALLRREAENPVDSGNLDSLYEAAQIMGITLSVDGELPKGDNKLMRIIMSGARECITNAVHHAKATKLNICISDENDYNVIEYTNDGNPPKDEITEGGGLSSLRKSVESEGGTMKIKCVPSFVLRLKIPKSGVLM
ncbi:MAG: sensor histidine kinase, partial [Acutalibacteraceae bacterium]